MLSLFCVELNVKKKMSNLRFVSTEVDGIEFYVSNDGKTTGMSIAGLARCCGVVKSTLRSLLNSMGGGSTTIEKLKSFAGKVFIDLEGGGSEKNARIVSSDACAAIITYYAFESKNAKNDVAKNTLSKFAAIGIDTWIKQLTNFTKEESLDDVRESLNLIISEIKGLKQINAKYNNVKNYTSAIFPGLDNMLNNLEEDDKLYLEGDINTGITLSQWLYRKGITLNRGGIQKFGRLVSDTYQSCAKREPVRGTRKNPNGKYSCNVKIYKEEEFPLLEMALSKFVNN